MVTGVIAYPDPAIERLFKESFGITLEKSSYAAKCLVLGGGADINPKLFFQKELVRTITGSPQRDLRELQLINEARMEGIPVIGICRGFQMIHVSLGGSLKQHIDGHRGQNHQIFSSDGSMTNYQVNSTHHQCVPEKEAKAVYEEVFLGKEGINVKTPPQDDGYFAETGLSKPKKVFGVQYHPERSTCPSSGVELFKTRVEELMVKG